MESRCGKKYRPSNSTEGEIFMEKFCYQCIHEKYSHTMDTKDKTCDILTATMFLSVEDPEYPKEWVYDANENPTCTKWSKWDWDQDDDGNWNDPAPVEPEDPNQLVMPFMLEDLEPELVEVLEMAETL